jgi:hypothetical protein
MPLRKMPSVPFAHQLQAQDQDDGSERDVRVERPLASARELALPAAEEVGGEVGRKVVAVLIENGRHDLEHEGACEEAEDALERG